MIGLHGMSDNTDSFTTVAGFMLFHLGRFPRQTIVWIGAMAFRGDGYGWNTNRQTPCIEGEAGNWCRTLA